MVDGGPTTTLPRSLDARVRELLHLLSTAVFERKVAIANEFRDQLLAEDSPRRAAEPITRRKFREQLADNRRELCSDGNQQAADEAIAIADEQCPG